MRRLGPTFAMIAALAALVGGVPGRARAQAGAAAAEATHAEAPKIAVVVVGDADERLRAAAVRVEDALVAGALRVADDAGLRAALRGEAAPAEDDGLASVRRVRRALGLGEAEDAPNLARLGRMAGAALVAVVRADGHGGVELVALQVAAAQFYTGALDAEQSEPGRIARAIETRARHALTASTTATTAATGTATGARSHHAPRAATASDTPREERSFLERSWPYFVVGALLAGAVTYVVLDTTSGNEATPSPVLRFSTGP